jgi:hypothetical protein
MPCVRFLTVVILLAACGSFPVGCEFSFRSDAERRPLPEQPAMIEAASREVELPVIFVRCRAKLMSLEFDHRWFDDSLSGHDDGVAPLASLVIVEPSPYAGRALEILFKFSRNASTASPPVEGDVGCQFSFQLPQDFLDAKLPSIDNQNVREFRKIQSPQ